MTDDEVTERTKGLIAKAEQDFAGKCAVLDLHGFHRVTQRVSDGFPFQAVSVPELATCLACFGVVNVVLAESLTAVLALHRGLCPVASSDDPNTAEKEMDGDD